MRKDYAVRIADLSGNREIPVIRKIDNVTITNKVTKHNPDRRVSDNGEKRKGYVIYSR